MSDPASTVVGELISGSVGLSLFRLRLSLVLPIKFPSCCYLDWQYAKRCGLLGETGEVTQSARECDFGGEERVL